MSEHPEVAIWTPPNYDISRPPRLSKAFSLEKDDTWAYNFARLAKWYHPDGSTAIAQCENRSFHLLDILRPHRSSMILDSSMAETSISPSRVFCQPSPILDFEWYPAATVHDPASYCFLASVRECPVKLLDAADGRLRASYKIVDHRERFIAPHSMAFNPAANKIYCGFEDAIEVFDIQEPGEGTRLHTTPSKKSRDGLKGIISALAFCRDTTSGMYAAGSLSPSAPSSSNIALFSETGGEAPIMFLGAESRTPRQGFGVRAGVMQMMFNPALPYLLYASFRRHEIIYEWDLRSDVSVPARTFHRHGSTDPASKSRTERPHAELTNQKLRFDIDSCGRWLAVGDQHGDVTLFDLATGHQSPVHHGDENSAGRLGPALKYPAHGDAVGSVAFHPLRPCLLSVSGSRHFDARYENMAQDGDPVSSSSDSEDDDGDGSASQDAIATGRRDSLVKINRAHPQPVAFDASVKVWNFEVGACRTGAGIENQ
ncbi:hypothetical protein WOLCODRAFT_103329 [Wolfiporia cocos MD-104 SS10]|uniref:WD40 repeat-like protein n=1 Tax=Wolfiporia cocos (strain MD-104) TaxID=742152 RepID=A0A2H3K4B9_WOLCO|nr:hypothetical protein WOLCODRAFT_103329 [Wolfiporia cocos MD-104 SS10]